MENIRVCHANNDNKGVGGAYIITRRVENEIRKYGFIFDYITMDEFIKRGDKDLDLLPGSIAHSARLRKNRLIGHIKLPFYAYNVFKKEKYKIVHIDTDLAGKALLYAIPAKLSGSKVIVHSHSTGIDGDHRLLKGFAHKLGRQMLPIFTDRYLACSQNAAKWMFPKRLWKNTIVLFNGMDFTKFCYDEEARKKKRNELGVNNQLVIGNIGIICRNKNQTFLIEILNELRKQGVDAALVLAGYSEMKYERRIREVINQYGLSDHVHLLGFCSDTNALLNAMDIYICPSLFEGFSLTLCEAQATGLPCIASEAIPDEVYITQLIHRLNLNDGINQWTNEIVKIVEKHINKRKECNVDEKYGLAWMAQNLGQIYDDICRSKSKII